MEGGHDRLMWIFASGSLDANLRLPMNFPSPRYLGAADASPPPDGNKKPKGTLGLPAARLTSLDQFNKGGGGGHKVGGRLDPT